MSYDTNYISPNHNASDKQLEPMPETVSDERYIKARKEREAELWEQGDVIREAVERNLSNSFITSIQLHYHAKQDGFPENAGIHRKAAIESLVEDIDAYIQELARIDIDNRGDEI